MHLFIVEKNINYFCFIFLILLLNKRTNILMIYILIRFILDIIILSIIKLNRVWCPINVYYFVILNYFGYATNFGEEILVLKSVSNQFFFRKHEFGFQLI